MLQFYQTFYHTFYHNHKFYHKPLLLYPHPPPPTPTHPWCFLYLRETERHATNFNFTTNYTTNQWDYSHLPSHFLYLIETQVNVLRSLWTFFLGGCEDLARISEEEKQQHWQFGSRFLINCLLKIHNILPNLHFVLSHYHIKLETDLGRSPPGHVTSGELCYWWTLGHVTSG